MLEFGIGLPVVQQVAAHAQAWEASAGSAELLAIARAADRLGYRWLGCSDHIAIPASAAPAMGATWYEPATTLAYVAAATDRIRLLAHVLVLPYRHPLLAAKTFATLDALSGGRVIIGTGSGHLRPEFRSLGIDADARSAISEEYLQAIAVALEQEVSSFAGRFVQWRDMMVAPRPVQRPRPPLWVGGHTVPIAQRAGRHADGWIPWQIDLGVFASHARAAQDAYRQSGRTGSFTVVAPLAAGRVENAAALVDTVAAWRAAGASAFHVGFRHHSCADMIELLERFAHDVVAPAQQLPPSTDDRG